MNTFYFNEKFLENFIDINNIDITKETGDIPDIISILSIMNNNRDNSVIENKDNGVIYTISYDNGSDRYTASFININPDHYKLQLSLSTNDNTKGVGYIIPKDNDTLEKIGINVVVDNLLKHMINDD